MRPVMSHYSTSLWEVLPFSVVALWTVSGAGGGTTIVFVRLSPWALPLLIHKENQNSSGKISFDQVAEVVLYKMANGSIEPILRFTVLRWSGLFIKRDSSPKYEIPLTIYPPSCDSKYAWLAFFCRTQKKIFLGHVSKSRQNCLTKNGHTLSV